MRILLSVIFILAMASSAMALEIGPAETLYVDGDQFSIKQTDSNGYDWLFTYIKSDSSVYAVVEAITGKSCNVLTAPELSKEVLICQ